MQPAENHRIDKTRTAWAVARGEDDDLLPRSALPIRKMLPNSRSKISATEDLDHEDQ